MSWRGILRTGHSQLYLNWYPHVPSSQFVSNGLQLGLITRCISKPTNVLQKDPPDITACPSRSRACIIDEWFPLALNRAPSSFLIFLRLRDSSGSVPTYRRRRLRRMLQQGKGYKHYVRVLSCPCQETNGARLDGSGCPHAFSFGCYHGFEANRCADHRLPGADPRDVV